MVVPQSLAFKYCIGDGVELGASTHNAFGLSGCINIAPCDGVDFLHPRDLEDYRLYVKEQEKYDATPARVDKIGDFRHIPARTASLDYVISSHVIEHEPNPIAAILESARVLKEGGIFFCIFPKRTAEKRYDIFRPLTKLEELISAYKEDLTVDKLFSRAESSDLPGNWRSHYYVYSLQSMLQLVNWINREKLSAFCIETVEETDSKVGNGHTIVLRKMSANTMLEANTPQIIEQYIRDEQYETALLAAKISLSLDYFQPLILYSTALLYLQMRHPFEAKEFYRQCLLQDPECEARRREFYELFGEYYINPLIL
jgi:SAM-dependent methyltransferase